MTPEQLAKFQEMYEWVQARKEQQIAYPLDEASRNSIGAVLNDGEVGVTLTQSVAVATIPVSFVSVPAAYQGAVVFEADGVKYILPYLGTV